MYTSPLNVAVVIVYGMVTGGIGAVLGTGGGVFLIPLLVLGLGVPMHYAVATSIVVDHRHVQRRSGCAMSNAARRTCGWA